MSRNSYWLGYIFLILIVVLSYTVFTGYEVHQYSRLSQEAVPESVQWSLRKAAEDEYVLDSQYSFLWNGKTYTGQMQDSEQYLNEWAGKEALDKMNQRTFKVWFDPSDANFSTINKNFPIKYSIYAGLLWVLFIYFVWLGNSIKNKSY